VNDLLHLIGSDLRNMNKPINKHPMYFQRLNRDVTDLLSHNFNCSSSCLSVLKDQNGITLNVCILEGPYRRGHFSFFLDIPINYPFKSVDVWAKHPIWHPNVDLLTGRVFLPLDWSPVLTLNSLALAVQVRSFSSIFTQH
jgi:ubiquitin-protein ligase